MKNVSIDEIYTKYINGSSVEELSSEYNVSENFIYKGLRNYAKERNIDIKTERRKNKIDMALVYEMHKSGISCEEIGELFNCPIELYSVDYMNIVKSLIFHLIEKAKKND